MCKAKKIGSFLIYALMSAMVQAEVHIHLTALDSNGKRTQTLLLDQPSMLQVTISGQDDAVGMPEIDALQDFMVIEKTLASTVHLSVNGISTTKKIYQFTIQPRRSGPFCIGPARIKINGHMIHSDVLKVRVVKETPRSSKEPKLVLSVDKQMVYPGEPFCGTVRFYPNKEASIEGISMPDFSAFVSEKPTGPYAGKEIQNEQEISYVEWQIPLIAQKPGKYVINPVTAVYKMQRTTSSRQSLIGFDIFDHFFSSCEQRQISSNVSEVTVLELPSTKEKINGVGQFEKLEAFVEPTIATQGEGIVFKLIVQAKDHNVHMLSFPSLDMPPDIKHYESKTYVQPVGKDNLKSKKIFEYIIQGTQPGIITIPKQKICFFDYVNQKYKTLESNSVSLTIKKEQLSHKDSEPKTENSISNQQPKTDFVPFVQDTNHFYDSRVINIYLWFFLIFLPVMTWGSMWSSRNIYYWVTSHSVLRKKRIFKQAHQQLARMKKSSNPQQLYEELMILYAHYFEIPLHQCTHEMLKNWSHIMEWHREKQEAYGNFIDKLLECSFGNDAHKNMNIQHLFIETKQWLLALEK